MTTGSAHVWTDVAGGVATVTIDNPPLNLLTEQVRRELGLVVEELRRDQTIRAVVFTGGGTRAFSAGSDIREFPRQPGEGLKRAELEHAIYDAIECLDNSTIAAINGPALGGGCELALACELRIAGEDCQLGLPEVKLGVFPSGGGTQRLPRLIGEARARELLYLGEPISAREAERIGLVNRVVPTEEVLPDAQRLARRIAAQPRQAIRAIQQCVSHGLAYGPAAGQALEALWIDRLFQSHDAQEGIAAFLAKRPPVFTQS